MLRQRRSPWFSFLFYATGVVLAACAVALVDTSRAEEWVRFRGPNGSGVSTQTVPTTWSETENLKWKTALPGLGTSCPVILGDKVFVTCFSGYSKKGGDPDSLMRHLVCINRADGKIVWSVEAPAVTPEDPAQGFINDHGYASSTPTTDGTAIYCFFGKSGAAAYDLDGKKLWQTSCGTDSSSRRWGSGASPILFEDLVIINAAEESRTIYGLDKKTGEIRWKSPADSLELSYTTPILVEHDGMTEMIVSVPNEVWGMNPKTGKLMWYAPTGVDGNASPSAIAHDGIVYVTGGRGGGTTAVRVGGKGDVSKTHVVWTKRVGTYVPSPVYHDGKLYWVSDAGLAVCLDAATGETVYRERMSGGAAGAGGGGGGLRGKPFYASVGLIGDKLYAVSRNNGTYVYEPGATFKILHHNTLGKDVSDCNASPSVADGELYIRSDEALYCIAKPKT